MKEKKIFFLGGLFLAEQISFIRENSSGVIQNAADAFQKSLVHGLEKCTSEGIVVINLPFVGSFPSRFKKIYFPRFSGSIGESSEAIGVGFINLAGLKIFFRAISAFLGLRVVYRVAHPVIIAYSAHLPFILPVLFTKKLKPKLITCLVIPDLPENMGGSGLLYSAFKKIDTYIFYWAVKRFDFVVVLTQAMAEKAGVEAGRYCVVEGIASVENRKTTNESQILVGEARYFLYTGTLAIRYGIRDLIEAFIGIKSKDIELWICGEGDGRDHVELASNRDSRIKYLGQVDRTTAVELQQKAFALVNPRPPTDDFTKYSFPSKTMEYMASGRPVIMHHLPGIPVEYAPYFYAPLSIGMEGLRECMERVLATDSESLKKMGLAAKNFVFIEKNAEKQSRKIIDLIEEERGC